MQNLPEDAGQLKELVISLEVKYQEKIHYLEEQLRLMKHELFGRRSEKRHEPHPDQMPLFHRDDPSAEAPQANDDKIEIAAHSRSKNGAANRCLKICRGLILFTIFPRNKRNAPAGRA